MKLPATAQARWIALKRRVLLAMGKEFDPFPPSPSNISLNPSAAHFAAYPNAPLTMSRRHAPSSEARQWQDEARHTLAEISGYDRPRTEPDAVSHETVDLESGLRREHLYLRGGDGTDVPVSVISPISGFNPKAIMICLQGTNSGAHLSWGDAHMPADPIKIRNGGDFAIQAVAQGYLAICVEQSCFGERRERHISDPSPCTTAANHAFLLGRTLVGDRARDVSIVVDWLEQSRTKGQNYPDEIYVMGSSSGGTTAVYAAALDTRISGVLASGCIGFVRETIGRRPNEGQAVIPGMLKYFEFDDIVALTAPRPFLGISGRRDHIFPFAGCASVLETAREVYDDFGAGDLLKAAAGEGGHRFYPEIAWPAFDELLSAAGTRRH